MAEVNLLSKLPLSTRNVQKREEAKDPEVILESKKFSKLYFDGPRKYGYGGYKYDGRWIPVAEDIVKRYGLVAGDKVLDIGCAKGFLVKDLMTVCPGLEVFGLDVSRYAITNCPEEVVARLHLGNAIELAFPSDAFDCVLAINVLHNLNRDEVVQALREINRVVKYKKNTFVQVDAYRSELEKEIFLSWVLTAIHHGYPAEWLEIFDEAGFEGDYFWTILEASGKNYKG